MRTNPERATAMSQLSDSLQGALAGNCMHGACIGAVVCALMSHLEPVGAVGATGTEVSASD